VSKTKETPFDSIESAQEFVDLLLATIQDVQVEIDAEIAINLGAVAERRLQALQLVAHNVSKLSFHVSKTRRILNDLRTLRRLLLEANLQTKKAEAQAVGAD
jgi:phospholipid N-methyltransferase